MAQMTQEFIAKILATEVGVKCRWGCAETEGLRDRLEITGCFSKVAECPELEQEIVSSVTWHKNGSVNHVSGHISTVVIAFLFLHIH